MIALISSVIAWFQANSNAFVALSAITATIAFVSDVLRRRSLDHEAKVNLWLKTNVHKLLHSSEQLMTAEEVLSKLRSSSFDAQLKVNKEKLTVEQVRMLLLEMLEANSIIQLWGDKFGIKHYDHQSRLTDLQSKIVDIELALYRLIYLAPATFSLNSSSLQNEVKALVRFDVSESELALILTGMEAKGLILSNKQGKWSPKLMNSAEKPKQIEAK